MAESAVAQQSDRAESPAASSRVCSLVSRRARARTRRQRRVQHKHRRDQHGVHPDTALIMPSLPQSDFPVPLHIEPMIT